MPSSNPFRRHSTCFTVIKKQIEAKRSEEVCGLEKELDRLAAPGQAQIAQLEAQIGAIENGVEIPALYQEKPQFGN
jgi:hypothetical protein